MERVKKKALTGLAALALASGVIVAVGPAGSAATVACGSSCISLASQSLGSGEVSAVYNGTAAVGTKVILSAAGEFSAEDFEVENPGTVAEFYADGVVGAAVGETWPSYPVYTFQYAPNGAQSGLCLGLGIGKTAANGTKVSLQTCGTTAQVAWIPLESDDIGGYEPLINASDTNANYPYVLTAGGSAGDKLTTHKLNLVAGTFNPAQMWENLTGVL
jgi:hypothetical protein